eukprot:gnl/TRDRNA2_/TRDRNA2_82944_c1_seq1.p1 gnl/TRDRNA2_/TRDRNA2_82944_c1~~gnl/TRDRNA2_/TRDRNA2_82944_c1_seq1.p1  ORF type:complete len:279 (+),score=48.97 gnl/TRDRNA2_/TRDRNA2_82944_c1_seq1:56-838(+)
MLGQLFALSKPSGLRGIVLSGPLSDAQLYIQAQWDPKEGSLGSLPPYVQSRIRHLEDMKAYKSAEYKAIDDTLTSFFTVRTYPPPDCFRRVFDHWNKEIYVGMQGESEFAIGGVLEYFNLTARLHEIEVPVLLTSGTYDTMRPPVVRAMLRELPRAEWHIFPHSGHASMIDDAGEMNDVVAAFLERMDKAALAPTNLAAAVPVPAPATDREAGIGQTDAGLAALLATTGAGSVLLGLAVGTMVGRRAAGEVGIAYVRIAE